jgi:hypothetical protein
MIVIQNVINKDVMDVDQHNVLHVNIIAWTIHASVVVHLAVFQIKVEFVGPVMNHVKHVLELAKIAV